MRAAWAETPSAVEAAAEAAAWLPTAVSVLSISGSAARSAESSATTPVQAGSGIADTQARAGDSDADTDADEAASPAPAGAASEQRDMAELLASLELTHQVRAARAAAVRSAAAMLAARAARC